MRSKILFKSRSLGLSVWSNSQILDIYFRVFTASSEWFIFECCSLDTYSSMSLLVNPLAFTIHKSTF